LPPEAVFRLPQRDGVAPLLPPDERAAPPAFSCVLGAGEIYAFVSSKHMIPGSRLEPRAWCECLIGGRESTDEKVLLIEDDSETAEEIAASSPIAVLSRWSPANRSLDKARSSRPDAMIVDRLCRE